MFVISSSSRSSAVTQFVVNGFCECWMNSALPLRNVFLIKAFDDVTEYHISSRLWFVSILEDN